MSMTKDQEVDTVLAMLKYMIGTPMEVQGKKYDIMTDIAKILKEKGYVVSKAGDPGAMFG